MYYFKHFFFLFFAPFLIHQKSLLLSSNHWVAPLHRFQVCPNKPMMPSVITPFLPQESVDITSASCTQPCLGDS